MFICTMKDYVATRWYRAPELCGSFFSKVSMTCAHAGLHVCLSPDSLPMFVLSSLLLFVSIPLLFLIVKSLYVRGYIFP